MPRNGRFISTTSSSSFSFVSRLKKNKKQQSIILCVFWFDFLELDRKLDKNQPVVSENDSIAAINSLVTSARFLLHLHRDHQDNAKGQRGHLQWFPAGVWSLQQSISILWLDWSETTRQELSHVYWFNWSYLWCYYGPHTW